MTSIGHDHAHGVLAPFCKANGGSLNTVWHLGFGGFARNMGVVLSPRVGSGLLLEEIPFESDASEL
jgi:hypothetical protein